MAQERLPGQDYRSAWLEMYLENKPRMEDRIHVIEDEDEEEDYWEAKRLAETLYRRRYKCEPHPPGDGPRDVRRGDKWLSWH